MTLPSDCEMRMTRLFAAPRHRVFDYYTDPIWLKRWLGPEGWDFALCDNDVVTGGRYRWQWRNPHGRELGMHGEYLKVVHSAEIVRTEIFEQDTDRTENIGWLLLTEDPHGTLVTTSTLFPSQAARDHALASGIEGSIAASFERLDLLLSTDSDDGSRISATPADF